MRYSTGAHSVRRPTLLSHLRSLCPVMDPSVVLVSSISGQSARMEVGQGGEGDSALWMAMQCLYAEKLAT